MNKNIIGPVKIIPNELIESYSMDGKIKIVDMYEEGIHALLHTNWDETYINSYKNKYSLNNIINNNVGLEPYGNYQSKNSASKFHYIAFERYLKSINCKYLNIAIIGSTSPWIEAILLNFGCENLTVVEYNPPVIINYDFIKSISYNEFINNDTKYDIIVSYSSVEHSGLGRYGDILNPNGDFETMEEIYSHLKDETGLLFWGAPMGNDILAWNSHRIYGKHRFPILFKNFNIISFIDTTNTVIPYSETNFKHLFNQHYIGFLQPIIIANKL